MKQITNRNKIKQLQLNFSIVSSYGIKLLIERKNVNKDISQTITQLQTHSFLLCRVMLGFLVKLEILDRKGGRSVYYFTLLKPE